MIPTSKCLASDPYVKASCTEEAWLSFVFSSLRDKEKSFCKSSLLLLIISQMPIPQKTLNEFQLAWKTHIEICFKNVLANYKQ
jgi:hypothetical protein